MTRCGGATPPWTSRARLLSLDGAAFPWRTIRSQECSRYWPAGTAAWHINTAVAEAVRRYLRRRHRRGVRARPRPRAVVETARLWHTLGHHDHQGGFRIDGVTGPDEYRALADNNTYTRLKAARNLRVGADLAARHSDAAAALDVDDDEIASWRRAASAMAVPFDHELGVTAEAEAFTRQREWDFEASRDTYPLLLSFPWPRRRSSTCATSRAWRCAPTGPATS